jgi:aminopeptidase N
LWLATQNDKALPGLTRKLPHYRKYSYLAFSGDAPDNVARGQWIVTDSPMWVKLAGQEAQIPALKLKPRQALAQLPPVMPH